MESNSDRPCLQKPEKEQEQQEWEEQEGVGGGEREREEIGKQDEEQEEEKEGKIKWMHLSSLQLNGARIFICSQDEITHGHQRN